MVPGIPEHLPEVLDGWVVTGIPESFPEVLDGWVVPGIPESFPEVLDGRVVPGIPLLVLALLLQHLPVVVFVTDHQTHQLLNTYR